MFVQQFFIKGLAHSSYLLGGTATCAIIDPRRDIRIYIDAAMLTGMVGVYLLRQYGLAQLHPKSGSIGSTVVGGLIFGVGFALLGYCPGTVVAAASHGRFDALFGGIAGMLIGAALFAAGYPQLEKSILNKGFFGERTLPGILNICPWRVIIVIEILVLGLFFWLERAGL